MGKTTRHGPGCCGLAAEPLSCSVKALGSISSPRVTGGEKGWLQGCNSYFPDHGQEGGKTVSERACLPLNFIPGLVMYDSVNEYEHLEQSTRQV